MQSAFGGVFEYEQAQFFENNGDFSRALSWYKKSSIKGNDKARDRSLSKDFHDIYFVFKCAESKDDDLETFNFEQRREAQKTLGLMFLLSLNGLLQDTLKAHYWLSQSANNGDPESHYYLGQMYEHAIVGIDYRGIEKNIGLALRYYYDGAYLGDLNSALRYADYVVMGFIIPQE
jgi:TPR repeat protein